MFMRFLCFVVVTVLFTSAFAKTTGDELWDILALALQNRSSLETDYEYSFTPSADFGDYLKAKQIVEQLRSGVSDPKFRIDEIEHAVKFYSQISKGNLIADNNRYLLGIETADKLGHKSISLHAYDGERYFVKPKPGPRWDIVSHPIGKYCLVSNLFTRPLLSLSPVPQGIEWASITFADIVKSDTYTKNAIETEDGLLTLRAIAKTRIPTSDGDLQQIFEIDLETKGQLSIKRMRAYRMPFQENFINFDPGQKIGNSFEIAFSNLPVDNSKLETPLTITANVYGVFATRMGGLTADEEAAVSRLLPKFPQNASFLLGTHKFTFTALDWSFGMPIERFRPPKTSDTIIFNYLTQSFENP